MDKIVLMWRDSWHRLIGTAIGWFVWDVAFYGNKLFQTDFTEAILDAPTLSNIYAFNWQARLLVGNNSKQINIACAPSPQSLQSHRT